MNINTVGGRKFLFGILLTILVFILAFMDKDAGGFITMAGIIYGTYVVGNVYQKKMLDQ